METTPASSSPSSSPSSAPTPPPAPASTARAVDYHLVRGALWGALLGFGVAIYLVLFAIVPFGDWLVLGLTFVAGIVIGLLWARFAPPRQSEPPPTAPTSPEPVPPTPPDPAPPTSDEPAAPSSEEPAAPSSDDPAPPAGDASTPPPPPPERDTT